MSHDNSGPDANERTTDNPDRTRLLRLISAAERNRQALAITCEGCDCGATVLLLQKLSPQDRADVHQLIRDLVLADSRRVLHQQEVQ